MTVHDVLEALERLYVLHGIAESSEGSGWLPYHTVPYERYIRECGRDLECLTQKVSDYYRTSSADIIRDIRSSVSMYDVDEEAKATLGEAFKAHEGGLYRACCRVLLPEIERVLREDWLGIKEIRPLGQKALIAKVDQYHLPDFLLDKGSLVLFGKIFTHLFEWFEDLEDPKSDTTPSRPGATHGWASYSTAKHSMNTIICADYVFRLVTAFKGRKSKSN